MFSLLLVAAATKGEPVFLWLVAFEHAVLRHVFGDFFVGHTPVVCDCHLFFLVGEMRGRYNTSASEKALLQTSPVTAQPPVKFVASLQQPGKYQIHSEYNLSGQINKKIYISVGHDYRWTMGFFMWMFSSRLLLGFACGCFFTEFDTFFSCDFFAKIWQGFFTWMLFR